MKIVYLDAYPLEGIPLDPIASLGDFHPYQDTPPDRVAERAAGAEVVIVNKVVLDREQLSKLPEVKLVCVSATGVNNVDTAYACERGVAVKNVAAYSTQSVAEATLCFALALFRNTGYYDRLVKSGEYSAGGRTFHTARPVSEIRGKTWGIVGLGDIGRRVASLAEAFGANVRYHSVSGAERPEKYPRVSLDHLLRTSHIVSLHTPLTETTLGLIGYQEILRMKPEAVLLNMARGGIVREADLARALNENRIAGAGLDVFEREPIDPDHPLLSLDDPDKLILAPHSAWSSLEARTVLVEKVAENIREYLAAVK